MFKTINLFDDFKHIFVNTVFGKINATKHILRHAMRVFRHIRTAKAEISLRIRAAACASAQFDQDIHCPLSK